jgi:hypothetical protein
MADILNTGTHYNIKGKISNYYYEGLLFNKNDIKTVTFQNGKHIIVDVAETTETEITKFHGISTFEGDNVPFDTLKGDKYFVIADLVRFGRVLTVDDLKGN